ncbi:beta-glucosidase [Alloscardovia macacae]|uniref:Beta-glucosidase n=2 Tax=Alloscardovia macacae TaxID=1160091 RepID=A0A261F6Z0_9BIFI|nr:beta-glucosidase [Alloscardovia macacae]
MKFNSDFIFGTATASYQIEGAVVEDGRTPSIWDTFSHTPGRVYEGHTGDKACDSYHLWEKDLDLLADLGVGAYRFSIAMPRVIPAEDGLVNARGLDYYERIVDGLLARDIKPVVTLYHWDLPQYLEDKGGWLNRDTAYRLADYTHAVAERLGSRVRTYTTLNEPWCSAYLGYGDVVHAPGLGLGPGCFSAVHHLNLAHGLMAQAVRDVVGRDSEVSVTLNLQMNRGDADAVRRQDIIANRVWLDPMLRGYYPEELFAATKGICDWSFIHDGDLRDIHQSLDVLGINYYSSGLLALSGRPQFPQDMGATCAPGCSDIESLPTSGPHTAMGWNIDPRGLYNLLMRLTSDYPEMPLMVTENGEACDDELVWEDGHAHVHDDERCEYVRAHLEAVHQAISDGADVRGYFLWSLLDNFEWAYGYSKYFGIVHMNYETMERTPKDSFEMYKRIIATREV